MHSIFIKDGGDLLAVDDDEMFLELIEFAYGLSGLPNKLITLTSGFACLDYLESCTQEELPSVVMMDINMPGMTGIETVRKIRSNERYANVSVITMLSSSNEENDIVRSLQAGATAYIEKPYQITKLQFVAE